MKTALAFLVMIFSLQLASAQVFAGTWEQSEGYAPVTIVFEWNKDSTYTIRSYTRIKSDTNVYICAVDYEITGKNSIRLRERKLLSPVRTTKSLCPTQMELVLIRKKKQMQLKGNWSGYGKDCERQSGAITLQKKKEE